MRLRTLADHQRWGRGKGRSRSRGCGGKTCSRARTRERTARPLSTRSRESGPPPVDLRRGGAPWLTPPQPPGACGCSTARRASPLGDKAAKPAPGVCPSGWRGPASRQWTREHTGSARPTAQDPWRRRHFSHASRRSIRVLRGTWPSRGHARAGYLRTQIGEARARWLRVATRVEFVTRERELTRHCFFADFLDH